MKFAHVATKWIGEEHSFENRRRADLPSGWSRIGILGNQYINLGADCPKPNIALVRVEESRKIHEGYIDDLKSNLNQVVIETWEDDGPVVPVASALKLKNFLKRQDMDEDMAEAIADATDRTQALLEALEILDKRTRRRIELGV